MARPLNDIYEAQARLHEIDAAAIVDEAIALRRRADAAWGLAAQKREEAAAIAHAHVKARLQHETGLSEREAEIMEREIATLRAERQRAVAQAATARQKKIDFDGA
ncbi:MAG TPA: hypothetical protein VIF57_22280 [Polyangia bacterium]